MYQNGIISMKWTAVHCRAVKYAVIINKSLTYFNYHAKYLSNGYGFILSIK